ncbi:MAG TPA: gliding motility-associated C-terminal domain-containing protein, partial [Flavobacteriales bacterium]|nr:gliding motility-associated C-terminal domain-containing protein [Flavobacteriales bacterium]
IVTGLAAGTYGVTISDAGSAGCTTHLDLVISEPLPISALILPESVNCFGDLATLFCTASGGTAQYNVVWNTPTPVFNDTLYNAAPGIYSVTVTDSSGCSFSLTDTLTEPLPLTLLLNVDSVGCFGSTPGSITAIVNGGTVPYSYEWSNDTTLNSNVNGGLSTGIYFIEVTDEHGCTVTAFDTVFGLDFPSISFTDSIACNGGSFGKLEVHPLGGSAGIVFSYVWNSSPVQYGLVASDLAAGTYTLTIQGGECVQNHTVVLGELPMRDSLAFDGVLCNGSPEVELFLPQNVNPGYQWYLNGISQPGQTTLSYEVLAGNVPITSATWFANGCRFVTTQAQITEYAIPSTTAIPNIFTPNDDALNRYFYPFVFTRATDQALINEQFQTFHMQIFNRWGQLMYESTNPNEGWNGNDIEGVPVSAGVYFVVMKYEALCSGVDGENIYQGTVQLVR